MYEKLVYVKPAKPTKEMAAMAYPSNMFVSQDQWEQMIVLEQRLTKMKGLISGFKLSRDDWLSWYNKPDFSRLPGVWGKNAADKDAVCKLLVCKILRPDVFPQFAAEFIKDNLGDEYVPEGMPSLDKVLKT